MERLEVTTTQHIPTVECNHIAVQRLCGHDSSDLHDNVLAAHVS